MDVYIRRQVIRFLVESSLLIALTLVVWYAYTNLRQPFVSAAAIPRFDFRPAYLLTIIALIFFALVFYGTSFEVTPLKLATAIFYPFVRLFASRLNRPRKATELISDTVASEVIPAPTERFEAAQEPSVDNILQNAASSASELATRMERRMNVYLILGVLVGFVGLTVWYFSFVKAAINTGWDLLREALPRITILIFIELLAGFFLRQYRIGVEDFKYFLALKRQADANRVSYFILVELEDKEAWRAFVSSISQAGLDLKLKSGESTTVLEAMKAEENVSLAALKLIGENLQTVAKWLQKKDK